MTTDQLASKVLQTLDAQQQYFKAARKGVPSPERNKLLEDSKAHERELRQMAQSVLDEKQNVQTSLF